MCASARELKRLLEISPDDQLAKQLLLNLDPDAKVPDPPKQVEPPKPQGQVTESVLQGTWTAKRGGSTFQMTLNQDGTYSWKYTAGGQTQEVTGVWEVDQDGILALEMNDEGVMLAQVIPKNDNLEFYMLGDTQGAAPLNFWRSK